MMQLVPIRKKYVYEKLERIDRSTGRVYKAWNFDIRMPSVTTILDGTKDKTHLKQWAASVGEEEAERIRNEAATVGTHIQYQRFGAGNFAEIIDTAIESLAQIDSIYVSIVKKSRSLRRNDPIQPELGDE